MACPGRSATTGPHHRHAPIERATALVDLLVDEVLDRRSVALAAPRDGIEEPERCGGSTARRSTPWPAPTSTPRNGSSTPSSASSPPPDAATGQSVDETAVDLALLEMAANGTALDAGQASLVRQMCTSGCPAAAGDRPGRRREDHRHACPHPGLDPRRRSGARPRPVRCRGRCSWRANRHPRRHPRQTHLVACSTASCPTGRPRSARRHW